jgi:nitrite reductase (NADH) large subunit
MRRRSRPGRAAFESYDRLLIATGSDPFIIPVPGKDLPGVVTFRDMDDVGAMLRAASSGGDAVVIGGGLLGLEAAHGLALRGMKVTVVHLMPTLMERQLDEAAGWLLKSALEGRGQIVFTSADTAEIYGNGKVEGVRLKDGREIPASLVVMAVGIRPNTKLAKEAGIAVGRGIHVDDHMVTSDESILAVGECIEHDGQVYGLVAPLWEMCRALADGLVTEPTGYTRRSPRPSSRSQGSTSSPPAISPAATAPRTSCCGTPRAGLQARGGQGRPAGRRGALW